MFPYHRPQRQRRRQSTGKEQTPGITPAIARSVVTEDDETQEQRGGELPAVQVATRQQQTQHLSHPVSKQGPVPHRTEQFPHQTEGHEVSSNKAEKPDGRPVRVPP